MRDFFNFLTTPLRIVLDSKLVRKLGLRSMLDERIDEVLPCLEGTVLDIGCGDGELLRRYGNGKGVEKGWDSGLYISESFDTVVFMASIAYVDDKTEIVHESFRLLKEHGYCIVTCIPFSFFSKKGMKPLKLIELFLNAGYKLCETSPFSYGLNRLYVFSK